MTVNARRVRVDALRGWLQRELGDDAVVYYQNCADPVPEAAAAERFSISVPVADSIGLVWLTRRRGTVRTVALALFVVRIVAEGVLRSQGRIARRDFVVHFRDVV